MKLHSVRNHLLYVAPIRIGLGVVWFLAARAAGVTPASDVLAFAGGVFVLVFISFNDPRLGFVRRAEPLPVPPGATYATPLEQALAATLPSTVGVNVLAAAALAWRPVLSAVLGGISVGLGVAGVLHALRADPALYLDRKNKVLYRR